MQFSAVMCSEGGGGLKNIGIVRLNSALTACLVTCSTVQYIVFKKLPQNLLELRPHTQSTVRYYPLIRKERRMQLNPLADTQPSKFQQH